MSFRWSTSDLSSSLAIKADHINSVSDSLQDFVNEGIGTIELKTKSEFNDNDLDPYNFKGFIGSNLIYRPEFYGSPSPRMIAQSGQTHFREANNDWSKGVIFNSNSVGSYTGIPGCCTTVKLRHHATVNLMASFYCFEFGGVTYSEAMKHAMERNNDAPFDTSFGYESTLAGSVRLEVNGKKYASTTRRIYTSLVDSKSVELWSLPKGATGSDGSIGSEYYYEDLEVQFAQDGYLHMPMIGRRQHHITAQLDLNQGVHQIGLVFKGYDVSRRPITQTAIIHQNNNQFAENKEIAKDSVPKIERAKNIFFLNRNFIVDCYYKNNTPI